jgi:hypothetical protein
MTDDKPKVIENVYLAEIRQEDGAQLFTWGEGENECMWLNGVQRASVLSHMKNTVKVEDAEDF